MKIAASKHFFMISNYGEAAIGQTVLAMLLAVMSSSATARWDKVGRTETYTAYVNPAAIRKAGNTVKVWQLFDYKTAQSSFGVKPYLSARSQYEYDCKKKRTRLLYVSSYSRNMGKGKRMAMVSSPSEWEPVPTDSILDSIWEIACGKQ